MKEVLGGHTHPDDPEPRRLLAAVAAGELDPRSDSVRELLDRCPGCREELREMLQITKTLDRAGTLEKKRLSSSLGDPANPVDRAWVETTLRSKGLLPKPRPEPASRLRRLLLSRRGTLIAAALLLVSIWIIQPFPRESNSPAIEPNPASPFPGSAPLLGGDLQLLDPVGEVSEWGRFRWSQDLPKGGWFVITVYEAEGNSPRILAGPETRIEGEWQPTSEETAAWPNSIRWEVQAFDATKVLCGNGWARARCKN